MNLEKARSELEKADNRLYSTSIFLLKMLVAGAVFQAVLYLYPSTYGFQSFLAEISATGLRLLGLNLEVQGDMILAQKEAYLITQDCLGWKSMAIFTALVFSSVPLAQLRYHLRHLIAGLALIIVANYIRILTTVYLSYNGVISFDIIHTIFWKWGLTVIVLFTWIYWLQAHTKTVSEAI